MHLGWGRHIYWSKHNCLIVFNERSGEIFVRGVKQTSRRYAELWAKALLQCPIAHKPKVLLLGLGGGGLLLALFEHYGNCSITAVEHDPIMVQLARVLHAKQRTLFPQCVMVSDAESEVKLISSTFDLVIVDLFLGGKPPAFVRDPLFWKDIKKVVAPEGIVIFNMAGRSGYEKSALEVFAHSKMIYSYDNRFVALWNEPFVLP